MNNQKNFKLKAEDIKDLLKWEGADACFATDRITVDGCKVGYMYRENPSNEIDSGWRFFEGTEAEDYINNPNNTSIYQLNTICNYDNDIIKFLNAPYGSAFERDKTGEFKEEPFQILE